MSYLKSDKFCTAETTASKPCSDSLRVKIVHTYISCDCHSKFLQDHLILKYGGNCTACVVILRKQCSLSNALVEGAAVIWLLEIDGVSPPTVWWQITLVLLHLFARKLCDGTRFF